MFLLCSTFHSACSSGAGNINLGRGVIIIWYGRINGFKIIIAPVRRVLQNNGDQFQNWLHGSVAPATCKLLVTFI